MPYPRVGFALEGGPSGGQSMSQNTDQKRKRDVIQYHTLIRPCGGRGSARMMYVYRMVQACKCVRARVLCPINHTHGVRSLALSEC